MNGSYLIFSQPFEVNTHVGPLPPSHSPPNLLGLRVSLQESGSCRGAPSPLCMPTCAWRTGNMPHWHFSAPDTLSLIVHTTGSMLRFTFGPTSRFGPSLCFGLIVSLDPCPPLSFGMSLSFSSPGFPPFCPSPSPLLPIPLPLSSLVPIWLPIPMSQLFD